MRYLLLILLVSCTPQKRLQILLDKHPELARPKIIRDTVIVNTVKKDTVFYHSSDTVILKQDNLTVKYFYNNTDSTIYLGGKCEGDTIYIEREVPVIQPSGNSGKFDIGLGGWILIIILSLCLLIWLIKK